MTKSHQTSPPTTSRRDDQRPRRESSGLVHTTAPAGYNYGIIAQVLPKYGLESATAFVQNIPGLAQKVNSEFTPNGRPTGCIELIKDSLNLVNVIDQNGSDTTTGNLHLGTFGTYDRFNIEYEI
jgi:hypothetical protein